MGGGMSTGLDNVQQLAKAVLAADAAFAGLSIFCEGDESMTADQLAAQAEAFERALLTQGVAVVILAPQLAKLSQVKVAGQALNTDLVVPVGICENEEVNRGPADPDATPARTPAGKSVRLLLEAAIAALLPQFSFPEQPAGRPEFYGGFTAYYLLAQRQHVIRSASPS
jgi:hypothetical protein